MELVCIATSSFALFIPINKLIPHTIKLSSYVASIISVIVSTLIIYNIWPILYYFRYNIFPEDYSFYVPFLTNITSFATGFYSMKIAITMVMPDLLPIAIRNSILNIINILESIVLILLIPYKNNDKTKPNISNYMSNYKKSIR